MSGRNDNSRDHWKSSLTPLLDDLQDSIKTQIEAPAAALGIGAATILAKVFMLHYKAKTNPDVMVWESFFQTVENAAKHISTQPWNKKLMYFLRGSKKRTGIQNEVFVEVQHVFGYFIEYYKPLNEPNEKAILDYIENFSKDHPGLDAGFNAIRLDYDNKNDAKRIRVEREQQAERDREDIEAAEEKGMTLEDYRIMRQAKKNQAEEAKTLTRLKEQIYETTIELIGASDIVLEPLRDGGYYFTNTIDKEDKNWYRLKDSIRDRMILNGGRISV